jgi:ribosomal protein S18 acetylase RimI-like enzyme
VTDLWGVTAREAELHAVTQWVGPRLSDLGEWVLRTTPGPRGTTLRRTNSCLAIGDPGLPLGEAVAAVRAFYASLDRPTMAQVEAGSDTEQALLAAGWVGLESHRSDFWVGSLATARGASGSAHDVETTSDGTRLLSVLELEGTEIGRGRGELNGEWLGVHGLVVGQAHRRRGHARALMAGLLETGALLGATVVWLEVDDDNVPARALYGALGLRRHHTCRYLVLPADR